MLSEKIQKQIRDYCRSFPQEESGGVVFNAEFLPLANVSKDKVRFYEADFQNKNVECIVHSHLGSATASEIDVIICNKLRTPYVIYSLQNDNFEIIRPVDNFNLPYVGRPYVTGLIDCVELIKDYYRQEYNITLGYFDYDLRIMHQNEAAFLDPNINCLENRRFINYFLNNGFVEIPKKDLRKGDVILSNSRKALPPHCCGVYFAPSRVLKHLYGQPSKVLSIDINNPHVVVALRHKSLCN